MNRPSRLASPVVELRQYTLKPGQRETLIALFDREFVETQEATGMTVIGQFRDVDRPDMFVWLRGFEDMETRKDALSAFYGGPVWAAHRDAANATMIDSDDVLLLKPAWPGAGFDLSGLKRPTAAEAEMSDRSQLPGFVEISIHHLRPGAEAGFAELFRTEAVPQLAAKGARLLGAFVTESAENTFPRLPVRTGENVFVSAAGFDNENSHAFSRAPLGVSPALQAFQRSAEQSLARPTEVLRLSPTARSLLGTSAIA
ncbi:NIPSNAP family protein [Mesorhizobium sp. M2D.F.Ca.ET.185.01.1.1]|uniref:NIPSNAP family protein n=1 Tax=unclassified Mesorhizobium TaxID=325217 RepID=UPI000FCB349A|nr:MULTISPECIES: NIPSNAP family protein [unclassified Mesorhizobium]TGP78886.1 NIPSNAP family protein [bacterium M00.F.Ca.ET.227.01.1.1]TGP89586.1 NIPSNAP family protein [bacterium M00.F.Ca.ET.221.01.1.1]TGP94954.1 NIPSNAP family protein [bacterium M00.F.Ca.ET.222.01.1.1]TGU02452.1 NIPSNAP family protein [bacterium M00.F.Ca.ET.163.01.1.1]TGU19045.1 NIPSNAP family protein [bacterium M00.F.Ca.ET.156.01.1.1]TGU45942.1 NIPSNAP family protein [bacterium M00.F.Ca.ET.146.01.1.1]TGV68517.1 NIPSNAP f